MLIFGSSFQLAVAGILLFVGWIVDRFGVRLAYGIAVALRIDAAPIEDLS